MAIETQAIRLFGPEQGVAGVRVRERIGTNRINTPRRGAVAFVGALKRGPMGVFVPISSRNQYEDVFGDKRDPRWGIYADGSQLLPDAIDGFFNMANGEGVMFVMRLDLEGKGKRSKVAIKNPQGVEVLEVSAANEGRWGGQEQELSSKAIIYATSTTFTVSAPGVESNEFIGAKAYFSSGAAQGYEVVANSAADPNSGEVIFTVSPQFDLIHEGVSGPVALTGTASYRLRQDIAGTISYTAQVDLTGTVNINGRTITGAGTLFTQELKVGSVVYYLGEARVVNSISSDTTLTISTTFSRNANTTTIQTDNLVVTGTGTSFTTIQDELVGANIYVTTQVEGEFVTFARKVASVTSDTELVLDSGFPVDLTNSGLPEQDRVEVSGATESAFNVTFSEISTPPTNIPSSLIDTGAGDQLVSGSPMYQNGTRYILHITDSVGTGGLGWVIYDSATIEAGGAFYQESGGFDITSTDPSLVAAWVDDQAASVPLALNLLTIAAGTVTAQKDNYWVEGTASDFGNELVVGNTIIDPNRSGEVVTVTVVDPVTQRFQVNKLFPGGDFTYSQLVKQTQTARIHLEPEEGQGLSVELAPGSRYPTTHFSMKVRFNGSLVLNVPDASLDPSDPFYVESVTNEANIAHRSNGKNYYNYVEVRNLWTSAYTTAATNDVRPVNGAGKILALDSRNLFTVGEFDYEAAVGQLFYPRPYKQAREVLRVESAKAPIELEGTISSLGVDVSGVGTQFESSLQAGDYLYDPNSDTVRKVRLVVTNTALILETAFTADIPALTKAKKAGFISVNRGIDLTKISSVGDMFLVSFPQSLQGGYDDDLGSIIPWHYTKFFDVESNALERAVMGKNLGLIRVATPGVSDLAVIKQALLYVERKAFEYRIEIPAHYTPAAADAFINQDVGRNDFASAAYPSYGYISDAIRGGKRLIPITGDIMGLESYFASIHDGYHIPAAGVEARLNRVLDIPYDMDTGEEASLTVSGLQPIKRLFGSVVIFGAECPAIDPIYSFLHIRRVQSDFVRIFLEAMPLLRLLFKPNQPNQAEQLRMILGSFMREEYRKGSLNKYLSYEQAVQIRIESPQNVGAIATADDSRDILTQIANGELNAHINYVPAGIIKNLFINLGPDIVTASYGRITN